MKEYIIVIGDEPDIMGNYGLKEKPKELVRCKDCKNIGDMYKCPVFYSKEKQPDDWFCADGERKE